LNEANRRSSPETRVEIGGGDVSVEIGGVVGKSLNLERFDGQGLHLIPDVPDREGGSGEVHEVGKVSGLGPI